MCFTLGKINKPMTQNQPTEADWRKFKSIIPDLRERYLRNRNMEFISILTRESLTPTENFWDAKKHMDKIEHILRDCLDDHRRSTMIISLMLMYRHQMIADEELSAFTEELRERIITLAAIQ
jgi:hypothetical protein